MTWEPDHPCLICRQRIDPAEAAENVTLLDLLPFCGRNSVWFMAKIPNWRCPDFQREPGDQ